MFGTECAEQKLGYVISSHEHSKGRLAQSAPAPAAVQYQFNILRVSILVLNQCAGAAVQCQLNLQVASKIFVFDKLPPVWYIITMNGKAWTKEEDLYVIEARNEKVSIATIAEKLERSVASVKLRSSKFIKEGKINAKPVVAKRKFTAGEVLEVVKQYRSYEALKRACVGDPNLPNPKTIQAEFGTWSEARKLAGVYEHQFVLEPNWPTVLYLVLFERGYYKVGITQRTVRERFRGYPAYTLLDSVTFPDLQSALDTEEEILAGVEPHYPEDLGGKGATECFLAPNFSRNSVPSQQLKLEDLI